MAIFHKTEDCKMLLQKEKHIALWPLSIWKHDGHYFIPNLGFFFNLLFFALIFE